MLRLTLSILIIVLLCLGALATFYPFAILNTLALVDTNQHVLNSLSYGTDARQKLDIYMPEDSHSAPDVVVFFYGGNWNTGSRSEYGFIGKALASRGIMTVVADYRLSPQVAYPVFVEDSAQAVAWTLKNIGQYGGNTARVFVAGHSAGAYNAAMVALDGRWLAKFGAAPAQLSGWIGIAGPYDFLPIVAKSIKPAFLYPNTPADSQPIKHISALAPPTLLISGTADRVVDPARNSMRLASGLRHAQASVQSIQFDGVGHGMLVGAFAPLLRSYVPVLDEISTFINHVDGSSRE